MFLNAINNPFDNPLFSPVVIRLFLVFVFTFPLVIVFNLSNIKGIFSSNIWKRYYAFFFIAPLYLAAIFISGIFSLIFLFVVMYLSLCEFRKMSGIPLPYHLVSVILAGLTTIIAFRLEPYFYSLPVIYFTVLSFIPVCMNEGKDAFKNVSYALFANIWINFSLAHFILTGYMENGLNMLILLGFSIIFSDVFAFVIGGYFKRIHFLDKYTIAENISPNKTFAGVAGNILGAGIGIWISRFAVMEFSFRSLVVLSIVIGIGGILGDLTESTVKRAFGSKDSGNLLPGHGGILDRIDSATRIIVIFYYYILIFE